MRIKIVLPLVVLSAAMLLSGCATPLGQQYGAAGAVGGAVAGGVLGGPRGAVAGGVIGAVTGGLIGDQTTYQHGGYAPPPPPVRQCYWHRVRVYDRWGNFAGYRDVCN